MNPARFAFSLCVVVTFPLWMVLFLIRFSWLFSKVVQEIIIEKAEENNG